ncbi:hypothetical protein TWF718_001340 [Orbilia javanica]|uniref:Uncharacterized protein n=1 Tax=Orbilia javanica TaxID=47235 RepID=A0AAN8NDQ5_9PEZI
MRRETASCTLLNSDSRGLMRETPTLVTTTTTDNNKTDFTGDDKKVNNNGVDITTDVAGGSPRSKEPDKHFNKLRKHTEEPYDSFETLPERRPITTHVPTRPGAAQVACLSSSSFDI